MPYEEDLQQNPYSLRSWLRYIENALRRQSPPPHIWALYERSLHMLPGSFKLWKAYLDFLRNSLGEKLLLPSFYGIWERSLLVLPHCPRLWIDYLECRMEHLETSEDALAALNLYDRALRSIPISQHGRLWKDCGLKLARHPQMSARGSASLLLRYRMAAGEKVADSEALVGSLETLGQWGTAARIMAELFLNGGAGGEPYLKRFIHLASRSKEISTEKLEAIVTTAIDDGRLEKDAGSAIILLSTHALSDGNESGARAILRRALEKTKGARDFGLIFDALAQLEELGVGRTLRRLDASQRKGHHRSAALAAEADWRLARFERLMARRPQLLAAALVRSNPTDASLWNAYVATFAPSSPSDSALIAPSASEASFDTDASSAVFDTHRTKFDASSAKIAAYAEALEGLMAAKAPAKAIAEIWICFSLSLEDTEERRSTFERAIRSVSKIEPRGSAEALLWRRYAADASSPRSALEILGRATAQCPRSLELWEALIEVERQLGQDRLECVKAAYEKTIELRIATTATIFAYVSFLDYEQQKLDSIAEDGVPEAKHSELKEDKSCAGNAADGKSNGVMAMHAVVFSVFERAIAAFGFPAAFDLWSAYLLRFERALESCQPLPWRLVERGRELYEQALRSAPSSKVFWVAFSRFEELFGRPLAALAVLRRGTQAVEKGVDAEALWTILIVKTREFSGLLATRDIFEDAIRALPDGTARALSLSYASLEASLGEVERARSVYAFGARLADPRIHQEAYWGVWESFERSHGSPETFRELLRIKRAIQAQFSVADVQFVPASAAAEPLEAHPFERLTTV